MGAVRCAWLSDECAKPYSKCLIEVQEEGKYLMAVVTALAVAALGILGVSAKGEKSKSQRSTAKKQMSERNTKGVTKLQGRASTDLDTDVAIEELPQSRLIIPPPDEPRIEAVAPKNDRARNF